jgi:hypothetical protein
MRVWHTQRRGKAAKTTATQKTQTIDIIIMAKLSKTELMALDLAIQVMKDEQMGVQVSPESFIGGIINVTRRVIDVTRRVVPVVQATAQLTPVVAQAVGAAAAGGTPGPQAAQKIEPGISVDALIALRDALARESGE